MSNNYEDELAAYVQENENAQLNQPKKANNKKSPPIINPPLPGDNKDLHAELVEQAKNQTELLDSETVQETHDRVNEEVKQSLADRGMGWLPIKVETLPTKGMFYPEGTRIMIRAASGGEIRHWSTMSDDDFNELDDAMNYVVERCCTVAVPGKNKASFKDLVEVDRFYIILAIRDFTFIDGNNELKITIDESNEVPVYKDNIDFIKFDDKLMKYYDAEKRCFVFDVKTPAIAGGKLNIYLPTVGVDNWFKDYVRRKANRQEGFDKQFVKIAPLLVKDYRNLNEDVYNKLINDTNQWGVYEWSLISRIVELLQKASGTPLMRYTTEDGAELTTPLNFRGGFKSMFTLDLGDIL